MTTKGIESDLRTENALLRQQIVELEAKVEFLQRHATLASGMRGERLVSGFIDGMLTAYAAGHDIETTDGNRIEVKYSGLSHPDKKSPTARWQWAKIFGERGEKEYDYVILVGDADGRYSSTYKDPKSPYVIFCIPRKDAFDLSTPGQRPGYRSIFLGSNPAGVKQPKSKRLYSEFQFTVQEMKLRLGL